MESKILIDINYSTREPQILIRHIADSEDPRDKLISMLTGQAMPGVNDGYCRIERCPSSGNAVTILITPLDPGEAIKHIPMIKQNARQNACIDTNGFNQRIEEQDLDAVETMCKESSSPDILEKWREVKEILKQTRKVVA